MRLRGVRALSTGVSSRTGERCGRVRVRRRLVRRRQRGSVRRGRFWGECLWYWASRAGARRWRAGLAAERRGRSDGSSLRQRIGAGTRRRAGVTPLRVRPAQASRGGGSLRWRRGVRGWGWRGGRRRRTGGVRDRRRRGRSRSSYSRGTRRGARRGAVRRRQRREPTE